MGVVRASQPAFQSFTLEGIAQTNPGFGSDEEVDEFIAAVREGRNTSLA
jgi:hypothetical protein